MTYQEREIKFYIQDLPALADRVRMCGADLSRARMLERNLRLDTADHSLKSAGRLLRIRQDDRVRVTYKENAQVEGGVTARTEIEFTTDHFEATHMLFEALGYRKVVVYEKYRSEWRLGDVVVALDELPLGDFIEIEAPNNTLIEGVAQMLGLIWAQGITTNYLGLFDRFKINRGLDIPNLTFEDFKGITAVPEDMGVAPADV